MSRLVEIIAREVEKAGALSFARFMELALYCPVYGYYEKEADTIGRGGDFFTSVSVGSLFGELLACQFAEWLDAIYHSASELRGTMAEAGSWMPGVRLVEAGAHDGRLAKDILSWMRGHRPQLFPGFAYCIVEPSARARRRQMETLAEFRGAVGWFADWKELIGECGPGGIRGVIFSNELLDAMPVHRLGWDAANRRWFEWGVTLNGRQFAWTRMALRAAINVHPQGRTGDRAPEPRNPPSGIGPPSLPDALLEILPDGFTIDVSPAARHWWREAADGLRLGRLLAMDYGLTAEEFFTPERRLGTLRAYHRHRVSSDLLANVGEQDLTAHVDFTAIQQAGEAAGLKTEGYMNQAKFLTQIATRFWNHPADFGEWTPARTRQFQTLTHPEHLGRPFRVLIQSRG